MIIFKFICIYLLIGIGIQLVFLSGVISDNDLVAGADLVDLVLFEDEPDHEDNRQMINDLMDKKRYILVGILVWPINVVMSIIFGIKFIILTR